VLALGACTSIGVPPGAASEPRAPTSETFSLMSDEELAAGMPHLQADSDAKTYTASFIHWLLTPGHVVERSHLLATGAPPDFADPGQFSGLVHNLSEEGNTEAVLFKAISSASEITVLSASQHPVAQFLLQTRRLHQGALLQKIEALSWLRKESITNKDAAFALGGFLIDQGASRDYLGSSAQLLATPTEIAEGTTLLKGVAAHTTLESLVHIADLLEDPLDTLAGDPAALRKMLKITVAATSTSLTDASNAPSGIPQGLGGAPGIDSIYQAASLRVALAELLEGGKGGPADVERAESL